MSDGRGLTAYGIIVRRADAGSKATGCGKVASDKRSRRRGTTTEGESVDRGRWWMNDGGSVEVEDGGGLARVGGSAISVDRMGVGVGRTSVIDGLGCEMGSG